MTLMLGVDEISRSLAGPGQPAAWRGAEDVCPPQGLTASRAHLVVWWRWRYARLEAKTSRLEDLLVQVLGEAQGYRRALHAALDVLHQRVRQHDRLREQDRRLRDEYRSYRERVLRHDHRAGHRNET